MSETLIFNGISFNKEAISRKSEKAFIEKYIGLLWMDQDEKIREQLLKEAYSICTPLQKENTPAPKTANKGSTKKSKGE
jgi:hypothetical protein